MQEDQHTAEEHLRGVFSSQEVRKVGIGATTRKTVRKVFWFADQLPSGEITLQALNPNYIPTGPVRTISRDELIAKYSPEPEFYTQTVFPKMRELDQAVSRGDTHREKGELFSAEYAYSQALEIDEENIRANFGIGLTYLERGETDKADNILERLVQLDAAFQGQHKHLFNDFGISLRKNRMFRQSIAYYNRALELAHRDENLHVNMARALLEEKEYAKAVEHLLAALNITPGNETPIKFLEWMHKRSLVPHTLRTSVEKILYLARRQDSDENKAEIDDMQLEPGKHSG